MLLFNVIDANTNSILESDDGDMSDEISIQEKDVDRATVPGRVGEKEVDYSDDYLYYCYKSRVMRFLESHKLVAEEYCNERPLKKPKKEVIILSESDDPEWSYESSGDIEIISADEFEAASKKHEITISPDSIPTREYNDMKMPRMIHEKLLKCQKVFASFLFFVPVFKLQHYSATTTFFFRINIASSVSI